MAGLVTSSCLRIGVLGGTFDPVHIGHLVLAMEAADQLELNRLLWVLTPEPPHKQHQPVTSVEIRLQLLLEAIRGNRMFELSRVELDRPGPHFAVDTMRLLSEEFAGHQLFYLIGGDSLMDFCHWRQPQEILSFCSYLGVMRRPNDRINLGELENALPEISEKVRFIQTPMLEISSSEIRKRILERKPYRYYLPDSVYQLIQQEGYYSNG